MPISFQGRILINELDVNLKFMLERGQSFRWTRTEPNVWVGVASKAVWTLKQYENAIEFRAELNSVTEKLKDVKTCRNFIHNYLRLDGDVAGLYRKWSKIDDNFKKLAEKAPGVRVLRQELVENIFSFICSTNNNIIRISSMVNRMCELYGEGIVSKDGVLYFAFPSVEKLCQDGVQERLRSAAFGYRAKFVAQTALKIRDLGPSWLSSLPTLTYPEAKKELLRLPGIGPKVADCICLMSLNHLEAVPVDTHVYKIAISLFLPELKSVKNLSLGHYNKVGDKFRQLFGEEAGWAQTVFFIMDLNMDNGDQTVEANGVENVDVPLKTVKKSGEKTSRRRKISEDEISRKVFIREDL